MMATDFVDWRLVVPIKGGAGAKSRLHPPPGVSRASLACAIARDCLAAACSGMPRGRVHVVTADPDTALLAQRLGAAVVPDPRLGLNAAVGVGIAAAAGAARAAQAAQAAEGVSLPDASYGSGAGIAVLLGDLPALLPEDLVAALSAAARFERAVVPDADGTGTVLLTARRGALEPAFGAGSAERHVRAGHERLDLDLPRLRTDVDDDLSLSRARALGLGPATSACLAALADSPATLPDMQASVHTFDEQSGSGTALLDDGREVGFSSDVFARSSLRHLRAGQRVSIELGEGGADIVRLWIVGIGDDQRIG
jgi:2-phospho-L-lactate guanylyltransferase